MYIIFALPDYSSEVIERHQNLFSGRLINLALEFDIQKIEEGIQKIEEGVLLGLDVQ